MFSFFNPNTWSNPQHEFRIYLDNNAQIWCVVDEIDYHWAVQWRWHVNKPHPARNGNKQYSCRSLGRGSAYQPKLYLHVEIHKRTGAEQLSPLHRLVDHKDGNEFNCRRYNLQWATHKMNRRNTNGLVAYEWLATTIGET